MTSVYWTDQSFCFQPTDQSGLDDEREREREKERERADAKRE